MYVLRARALSTPGFLTGTRIPGHGDLGENRWGRCSGLKARTALRPRQAHTKSMVWVLCKRVDYDTVRGVSADRASRSAAALSLFVQQETATIDPKFKFNTGNLQLFLCGSVNTNTPFVPLHSQAHSRSGSTETLNGCIFLLSPSLAHLCDRDISTSGIYTVAFQS